MIHDQTMSLTEEMNSGILYLPEGVLLLKYKKNKAYAKSDSIGGGLEKRERRSLKHGSLLDCCRRLIKLFQNLDGMEKRERRGSLYMGFEVRERKWLDKRRVSDELADLSGIVEGVKGLGKLDQLIENAKLLTIFPEEIKQLDDIRLELERISRADSALPFRSMPPDMP